MSDPAPTLNEHQAFERDWWGDCSNTFGEEAKQLTYAEYMGLVSTPPPSGHWPCYDLQHRSVLDIGGGPASMLLKTFNRPSFGLVVVDPCPYPAWTRARYQQSGISLYQGPAETFATAHTFDEVWIYNVLQHVEDPVACLRTARRHAHAPGEDRGSILRIFEWVNTAPCLGHPHTLTRELINEALGFDTTPDGSNHAKPLGGKVTHVSKNGAVGLAYYGCLPCLPLLPNIPDPNDIQP